MAHMGERLEAGFSFEFGQEGQLQLEAYRFDSGSGGGNGSEEVIKDDDEVHDDSGTGTGDAELDQMLINLEPGDEEPGKSLHIRGGGGRDAGAPR